MRKTSVLFVCIHNSARSDRVQHWVAGLMVSS